MPDSPSIDRNQLQKLADLARLHLPADRQAQVLQHLRRIVTAFEALRELPRDDRAAAPPGALRLRLDTPASPLPVEQVLANAPHAAGGMFVVPRVVDA